MKKAVFILLGAITIIYGYQAYRVLRLYYGEGISIKNNCLLSDIAEEVTAVPLKLSNVAFNNIKRDKSHLFAMGNGRLMHFDMQGNHLNDIATDIGDNTGAYIAAYTIDTDKNHIVVVDSQRNICRYDYNGNAISRIPICQPWLKMSSFSYYSGFLWATATSVIATIDGTLRIEHSLYQLDDNLNDISHWTLYMVHGTENRPNTLCVKELASDEDGIYAYFPPANPENLLEDTLRTLYSKRHPLSFHQRDLQAGIYPIRKGGRYMTSSYQFNNKGYIFIYDTKKQCAYQLEKGIEDDIFKSGNISDIAPMDVSGENYYYTIHDKGSTGNFHTTLYIVTLKGV